MGGQRQGRSETGPPQLSSSDARRIRADRIGSAVLWSERQQACMAQRSFPFTPLTKVLRAISARDNKWFGLEIATGGLSFVRCIAQARDCARAEGGGKCSALAREPEVRRRGGTSGPQREHEMPAPKASTSLPSNLLTLHSLNVVYLSCLTPEKDTLLLEHHHGARVRDGPRNDCGENAADQRAGLDDYRSDKVGSTECCPEPPRVRPAQPVVLRPRRDRPPPPRGRSQ